MKLTVKDAVNALSKLNPNDKILIWYRTKDDMGVSSAKWESLTDDSQALEDVIDEYLNGWLDE